MGPDALARSIDAARRGDTDAVERLCAHFWPRAFAYVSRSLGARARRWVEPADVAQTAVFEVMRALRELGEPTEEELLKRLQQTARSRMRDAIRKHRRELGESVLAELGLDRPGAATSTGSVTRSDAREHLMRLLGELPPELSEAVRLCALEELSFVEAGRRIGLTADAVRKRYDRARAALAARLVSGDSA